MFSLRAKKTSSLGLFFLVIAAVASTTMTLVYYKREATWERHVSQESLKREGAYATALYHLGTELYTRHANAPRTWILSVHNASNDPELQKLADNQFLVVSIPAIDQTERTGIELFATHHNSWVMRRADLMALDGNFEKALLTYAMLERFDVGGYLVDGLKDRISLVEKLKAGITIQSHKKALQEVVSSLVPSVFERIETDPVTITSNLLSVKVKGTVPSNDTK